MEYEHEIWDVEHKEFTYGGLPNDSFKGTIQI
jgi:hypothetical protein